LFLIIATLALVGLAAGGLHCLTNSPAWAQEGPPGQMAPGGAPGGGPGGPPGEAAPPLPNPQDAFTKAQSKDIDTRSAALRDVATLYNATQDEAVRKQAQGLLRQAAQQGETAAIRQAAVGALGMHATDNTDLLLQMTYDPDAEIANAALAGLAQGTPSATVTARLQQLRGSRDTALATLATEVLTQVYGRQGLAGAPALIEMLGSSTGDANAKAALRLLGLGRDILPACVTVLTSSPNDLQRHGAGVVIAMLCGGKNQYQEAFAQVGQAEFKVTRNVLAPDLRVLPALLTAVRNDRSPMVREICAQALSYLGDERAVPVLAQALQSDPEASVRAFAAGALVTLPAEAARPALERALETDKSARVRRNAAEALGWLGDQAASGALIAATRDRDEEVRRLAAAQLGRVHGAGSLEALTALFGDSSEDVRWAAVVAVDKMRDRRAVPALVSATQDTSVLVSHAAETALQKLGETYRQETNLKQPARPAAQNS
jgi:HEAT repeat protein